MNKRRKICLGVCIPLSIILSAAIIALGITIFFIAPRKPQMEYDRTEYSRAYASQNPAPGAFNFQMNIFFNVSNPNYARISIIKLYVDIYYREWYLGFVERNNYTFVPRSAGQELDLPVTLVSDASTAVAGAQMAVDFFTQHYIELNFNGTATIKYTSVKFSFPFSFKKQFFQLDD